MKKVVYNACHGGFSFSSQALMMLHWMGLPATGTPLLDSGYTLSDFSRTGPYGYSAHATRDVILKDGVVYSGYDFCRTDTERSHPIVVRVVELLGKKANGSYAKLAIKELAADAMYRITEYDGFETVVPLSLDNYTHGYAYSEVPLDTDVAASFAAVETTPSDD